MRKLAAIVLALPLIFAFGAVAYGGSLDPLPCNGNPEVNLSGNDNGGGAILSTCYGDAFPNLANVSTNGASCPNGIGINFGNFNDCLNGVQTNQWSSSSDTRVLCVYQDISYQHTHNWGWLTYQQPDGGWWLLETIGYTNGWIIPPAGHGETNYIDTISSMRWKSSSAGC